jgi:phosphoribosylformylglycinamidine synthase subunit PurS
VVTSWRESTVSLPRREQPGLAALAWAGRTGSLSAVARVVVDVVLKPEILDPQGQAIARALPRLGFEGVHDVRQGKHFELDVADTLDDAELHRIAGELLANPVIEDWAVRRL